MTDSSEASKDGREASDDSSGVAVSVERRLQAAALCLALVARALRGSRALTRK